MPFLRSLQTTFGTLLEHLRLHGIRSVVCWLSPGVYTGGSEFHFRLELVGFGEWFSRSSGGYTRGTRFSGRELIVIRPTAGLGILNLYRGKDPQLD